jgi:hypothetical protein
VPSYALGPDSPVATISISNRILRRRFRCLLVAVALVGTAAGHGRADEPSPAMRELAESTDFRVRVSAALVLGHTHPAGAREALEEALCDSHPAVRVAAARSLGALGDAAALAALQRRLAQDPSASVTAQVRVAIGQLRRGSGPDPGDAETPSHHLAAGTRYVIELGMMHNRSNVKGDRGEELERALGEAARARARVMRGTAMVEGDDSLRQQAAERHIPILTLDGNLTQISEVRVGGGTQVQVRVEFAVRRGQTLKGTVSGAATTFGPGTEISDEGRCKLEEDAVTGAVQSALRGAEEGLLVAAR